MMTPDIESDADRRLPGALPGELLSRRGFSVDDMSPALRMTVKWGWKLTDSSLAV
jgi:hypothetical protein